MLAIEGGADLPAIQLSERNHLDGAERIKLFLCSLTQDHLLRRAERAAGDEIDLQLDIDSVRRYLEFGRFLLMHEPRIANEFCNTRTDSFQRRRYAGE